MEMKTRILGKTGLNVSELGLGSAFMAGQGQAGVDRCVDYAVDHGINYFDTSANYGDGTDEAMLGAALKGKRAKVILATKVGFINHQRYSLKAHRRARPAHGAIRGFAQATSDRSRGHHSDS